MSNSPMNSNTKSNGYTRKHLKWNLWMMMAQGGIRTATELRRRLLAYGLDLSSAHLSRLVQERPSRISTELLDALVSVLECDISDLLTAEVVLGGPGAGEPPNPPTPKGASKKDKKETRNNVTKLSDAPASGSRKKTEPSAEMIRKAIGPKVTALPIPAKK